jgi:hypothetical protein
MVSVSYSLALGDDYQPDKITVGTSAPGAGDVEVRILKTNLLNKEQACQILEAIIRRIRAVGTTELGVV